MSEAFLYKLLNHDDARSANLSGMSNTALDEADGYVHLSTRAQVAETAALYYRGKDGVVLLEFDAETIGGEVRWETSRGGALFPHLFAPLAVSLATRRWTLDTDEDGTPLMPGDLDP